MVAGAPVNEASSMQMNRPGPAEEHALTDSAQQLQRAAGNVQKHAADADRVPTHAVTLAHVEEALDRLSVGMLQMANGVVDWNAEHGRSVGEDDLPPLAAYAERETAEEAPA